jgi:LysM repeat protein
MTVKTNAQEAFTMRHLLVTSLLLAGLTLGGVSAVHAEGKYEQNSPEQEMTQPRSDSDFSGESSQYTVQEGDTLASIAEEHLGSADQWQLIATANDLSNPDQLEVGQILTIPASGETSDAGIQDSSTDSSSLQSEADSSAMQNDMNSPESPSMDQPESDAAPFDETARDFESDTANDPAAQNDPALSEEQEIRGEITEIASGNESLTLKDENGMTHNLKLEDEQVADGISVGDFVKAEIEGGTVVSLEKVDRSA